MLKDIFLKCKGWLFFAYLILFVEFTIFALLPYLLGRTIDALLVHNTQYLYLYVGILFVGLLIGFGRRRIDARIFLEVWRQKVTESVNSLIERNVEPAKIIVRASNIKQCADFFEILIPQAFASIMSIFVSIIMLILVLRWWVIFIASLTIASLILSYWFSIQNKKIESTCQSIREERESRIVAKDFSQIADCYQTLKKLYTKQSDLEACNWGLVDICSIVAQVTTVIILVQSLGSPGTIMSTLSYVDKLFNGTSYFVHFFRQTQQIQVIIDFLEKD